MASEQAQREQLIRMLDDKVFDPILRAPKASDQSKLDHVKRSTENEKRRYHDNYRTAKDVRQNYLSDLSSDAGKRITRELEELGLPTLPSIKQEFLSLCDELGVSR